MPGCVSGSAWGSRRWSSACSSPAATAGTCSAGRARWPTCASCRRCTTRTAASSTLSPTRRCARSAHIWRRCRRLPARRRGRSRTRGLLAPLSGILVPLERVPDPVFAQRTVGDGVSIDPTSCEVLAPAAGLVTLLNRAAHALAITTEEGLEILVHIGVDTIGLNGKGFTPRVRQGDRVVAGQPLISFAADLIARSAPSLLTQVLVTNRERLRGMTVGTGLVDAGRSVILSVELAAARAPLEGTPA